VDQEEIKLAQTTVGLLFRHVMDRFSHRAAQKCLRRGFVQSHQQTLRNTLGQNYAIDLDAFFLPFVDSDELHEFKELSDKGIDGKVLSAVWKCGRSNDLGISALVPVALKKPKQKYLDELEQREKFLNEVFRISCEANQTR
jgi:hypothetical protein